MKSIFKPQVTAGYTLGGLVALVTWALVRFIPAFRHGLPPDLATLIPAVLGVIAHSVGTALAPEAGKVDDVLSAVVRVENVASTLTHAMQSIVPAPAAAVYTASGRRPEPTPPAAGTEPPIPSAVLPVHEQHPLHQIGEAGGKPILGA